MPDTARIFSFSCFIVSPEFTSRGCDNGADGRAAREEPEEEEAPSD